MEIVSYENNTNWQNFLDSESLGNTFSVSDEIVTKVIKSAKEILETKGWCQGWFGTDEKGNRTLPEGSSCFCATGALIKACIDNNYPYSAWRVASNRIESHVLANSPSLVMFNDAPSTTKEDVIEVFNKALGE